MPGTFKESLAAAWPYLWSHRAGLARGFTALILKDACAVCLPLVIRQGVDSLTQGFRVETVLWLAAALAGLSAVKGFFQYWMRVILIGISRDIEYALRNDLFAHLARLSHDFYARFRTGDIMARATNDLNAVRMMLGPGVMYWFETVLMFLLALAVMLSVDWRMTLLALAPAPLVSLVVVYFGRQVHTRFEKIQEQFGEISNRVQENLAGVRIVRAYAREEAEMAAFEALNRDYIRRNLEMARKTGVFWPLLQALAGVTFLIVLWAGGLRVMEGGLTIGAFVMFQTYMGMLIWPMIAFGWVINLTERGKASFKRILEILNTQPGIAAPADGAAPMPARLRGEIEFRDVTLDYGGVRALDGVTLRVPAGATVALVGHTGSGKSSLVNLVPRLLDPTQGQVLVDGVDVRRYHPQELRRQIGFVPQETFLFSTTLAGNIAFGAPDATPAEIERAAGIAGLGPDVAAFPEGYATMIGERGLTLSGGQKQRTAIARAILRNPAILILDDALASVDTVTEERILTALADVTRQRTTILISHRVSTVRMADRIHVIEHGRVAEEGTHDELLALGGYYADLHQRQLLEEEIAGLQG